jgi:hypothetical protein
MICDANYVRHFLFPPPHKVKRKPLATAPFGQRHFDERAKFCAASCAVLRTSAPRYQPDRHHADRGAGDEHVLHFSVPVSLCVSVGASSCVLSTSERSRTLQKSKDGLRQARTYLSEALWGQCVERSGLRKLTPMWRRFAAAIRAMRAAICPAKSPSPRSCSPPSTSKSPGVRRRRAF